MSAHAQREAAADTTTARAAHHDGPDHGQTEHVAHAAAQTHAPAPSRPDPTATHRAHAHLTEEDDDGGLLGGLWGRARRAVSSVANGASHAATTATSSLAHVAHRATTAATAATSSVANAATRATTAATTGVANLADSAVQAAVETGESATGLVRRAATSTTTAVTDAGARAREVVADALLGDDALERHELPTGVDANGRPQRIELEDQNSSGLLGSLARGVRAAGGGAADLIQRAAPVIDLLGPTTSLSQELAEEVQDMSRGVADHFDEDLRLSVEASTGRDTRLGPYADREFRLEDEEQQDDVRTRTRQLFDGVDGAGTNPEQIRQALRGASPETIRAMRAEYSRVHHRDMLRDIDLDVSGADEDEIEGMLTGDPVEQAVAQIERATYGVNTDEATLEESIRRTPSEQRDEVIDALGGTAAVRDRLIHEAPIGDGRVAVALLENREADAIAYRLDDELNNGVLDVLGREVGIDNLGSPDQDALYSTLENIPPEQREAVLSAYSEMGHRRTLGGPAQHESLETALARELDEGPERERALALAGGDRATADAHALAMAADEPWYANEAVIGTALLVTPLAPVGVALLAHTAANQFSNGELDTNATDTAALTHVLERHEGEDEDAYDARIARVREVYNQQYGGNDDEAFDQMLRDELVPGSLEYQRARDTLEHHGEMYWRVQLEYATERNLWSTDEEMTLDALRRAPREQIDKLPEEERQALRERLYEGSFSELDGRPALEAEELLDGPPQSPAEWLERWERRHDLDRDTWGAGLVDIHSTSGDDYDRHLVELRGCLDENGQVREGQQARFDELRATLEGDQGSYRARQDETADVAAEAAATTAAVVTTLGITIASGGTAAPAAVAAAAALLGGGAGMATRGVVLGDAYEREDILRDGVQTAVSAAGAGATTVLQTPMTSMGGRMLGAIPGAALEMSADLAMTEGENTPEAIGRRALVAGGQVVGSGVSGTVSDELGGAAPSLGRRMLAGAVGGLIEGGITTGANVDTFDEGLGTAVERIGGRALIGGATSSLNSIADHVRARREARIRAEETALEAARQRQEVAAAREHGIDARDLLALQAEHGAEVAVSAPRLPDGTVAPESAISIGTSDGANVPEGHVGSAHTHPNASEDPRLRFPSDGQGDLGSVRRHGNTQAVVHDEGVTVFHPNSRSQDIDGMVGEHGSVQPVARSVDNVTSVDTTQVVLTHDPNGSVVLWPSADNPEQGMLPVSFPQGDIYAPGTSAENVEALRQHNEAQQQEAARIADESETARAAEAARAADAGRAIVGWTNAQEPVYEGERPTSPWRDHDGHMHFPSEE